ncbi:MAG: putative transporter [Bacteroidales bacterium]|nr:putative transporter [Bacteroidales bacterium]
MAWLNELIFGNSIAHGVMLIALVIALGTIAGKLKIAGISLGATMVLFVGIIAGHFGLTVEHHTLHFLREFGLILFVFSIGMQVGPGFFASFKKEGITLNLLAVTLVFLGVIMTIIFHYVLHIPMATMVGILSGAVTNTPGLGAAQQTYSDMYGDTDPNIALGYAVAYPLGVVGIIFSLILIRYFFRISLEKEGANVSDKEHKEDATRLISLEVLNSALFGKDISEISQLINRNFVISRVFHNDHAEIATPQTPLNKGDKIFVVTTAKDAKAITAFIGQEINMNEMDWNKLGHQLISRRILITKSDLNGKKLGDLKLRATFGVNITRINRAGMDLVASPNLTLQMGDRVMVVGTEFAIKNVEKVLGNSLKRLNEPNIITIFIGIFLGVVLGSIPFVIPGIPYPVKLGLAGGPLIVSILIGRFGYRYHLTTYTTMSANLMLREIGITLFLACVGIGAGSGFVDTLVHGDGLHWVAIGVTITMIPILIVGTIARSVFKINYFTLMGLISGSTTDPPALAYSTGVAGNDMPSIGYATVYPFTMFLRVITAQLLILFFV